MGKVGSPVQLGVCLNGAAPLVHVGVDEGCNSRQLGNDVQAVLHDGLPVVQLVDALAVGGSKLAVGLQSTTKGQRVIPGAGRAIAG